MKMKTRYIKPESIIINVKLFGSVLDKDDVVGGSKGAGGEAWGKENNMVEEEEIVLPTQSNLWADDDEE